MATSFEQVLAACGVKEPSTWGTPFLVACSKFEINTPLRLAAFLANTLYESSNFSTLEENMNYAVGAVRKEFPNRVTVAQDAAWGRTKTRPANQQAIAEHVYGGRLGNKPEGSGDGWLFRGHGLLQTTFRNNYVGLAKAIGWTQPVEELPAYLTTVQGAIESATSFWHVAKCNDPADKGDIATCRKIVNGGTNGLDAVTKLYARLLVLLHAQSQAVAPPPPPEVEYITSDELNAQELERVQAL